MKLLQLFLFVSLASTSSATVPFSHRQTQSQTCGVEGDRAQDCGATNSNRPVSCCPGLVCAAGISSLCVEPFPTASPTPAPPECGVLGERSQQCGATDSNRPAVCCPGLVCAAGVSPLCVEPFPTASPTPAPPECGVLGERSQQCGARDSDRPELCCDGLVCSGSSPRCVEPVAGGRCSGLGERARDCGAPNTDRPQACCPGFRCSGLLAGGQAYRCIEDIVIPTPPPVAPPTAAPSMTPTANPTFVWVDSTNAPPAPDADEATFRPTLEPTSEVGGEMTSGGGDFSAPAPVPAPVGSTSASSRVSISFLVALAAMGVVLL